MTHIIRRQTLDIALSGSEAAGLALQRRLPSLCHDKLTPALERVLDRHAPEHGYLSIERLDIAVGTIMLERLEQDLAEKVAHALEQALREQIRSADSASATSGSTIRHSHNRYKTVQQTVSEALLYFLQNGSLPWSFRLPPSQSLEQVLLDAWQQTAQSATELPLSKNAVLSVLKSAAARQRLSRQFSAEFLKTLLVQLAPQARLPIDELLPVLEDVSLASAETDYFQKQTWETIFAAVATADLPSTADILGETWLALPSDLKENRVLAGVLEQHWPGVTNTALSSPVTTGQSDNMSLPGPQSASDSASPLSADRQPTVAHAKEPAGSGVSASAKKPLNTSIEHPEAAEGIYIENAGLVLLHPFLPQFFSALDIAAEDQLIKPERALCLLHFLATGHSVAPEYELVLPKILCNLPLLAPVDSSPELSDPEKEEATALLEAVIGHWEVLRNTSPDGLRGTFLLRPGKVSQRSDGDWLLQVEASSFDILLDQLPWGISMIKLPWMKTLLWVEWR